MERGRAGTARGGGDSRGADTIEAPNANAYAERFVRSMKEECLDRIIPIGEGHLRRAMSEFVAHYHRERNHQGLENALIEGAPVRGAGRVYRQSRLGGLLNYYRARSVINRSSVGAERWDITGVTRFSNPTRSTTGVGTDRAARRDVLRSALVLATVGIPLAPHLPPSSEGENHDPSCRFCGVRGRVVPN